MDLITALAVSIGLLGGVATYLFLADHFGLGLQIWAAFIAWASFYHCGGKAKGFLASVLANLWGVAMATLTLLAVTRVGLADTLTLPVWAGICVAIGVGIMIFGTKIPIFSAIPATVYGYAATVALALLANNGLNLLVEQTLQNPAAIVAASMVIGTAFGYISEALAGALAKS